MSSHINIDKKISDKMQIYWMYYVSIDQKYTIKYQFLIRFEL